MRPGAICDSTVWNSVAQNVVGALAAGALALVAGSGHPYWAVVSVVAVLPPPGAVYTVSRAFRRMIGTTVGIGLTALVLLPDPPAAVLILVIALGQFGAEILIGRHDGAALLFSTRSPSPSYTSQARFRYRRCWSIACSKRCSAVSLP